jgi:hypothetical protein
MKRRDAGPMELVRDLLEAGTTMRGIPVHPVEMRRRATLPRGRVGITRKLNLVSLQNQECRVRIHPSLMVEQRRGRIMLARSGDGVSSEVTEWARGV